MLDIFAPYKWEALFQRWPDILAAFGTTVGISVLALVIALALGIVFGVLSVSRIAPLRWVTRVYVEVVQNVPLLLQVFVFYAIFPLLGFSLAAFWIGVLAIGIYHGGYISEVVRSGIGSIHRGQFEAAKSQGFSYWQSMFVIILPQAIRIIMPPLAVQAANLVKNTSVLALIAGGELMYFSNSFAGATSYYGPVYVVAALLYFVICFPLSRLALYLERRTRAHRHLSTGDATEELAEDALEVTPGTHDITGRAAADALAGGVGTMFETVDIAPARQAPSPRHPLHVLGDEADGPGERGPMEQAYTGRVAAEIADEIGREIAQEIAEECGDDEACAARVMRTKAGRVKAHRRLERRAAARRGVESTVAGKAEAGAAAPASPDAVAEGVRDLGARRSPEADEALASRAETATSDRITRDVRKRVDGGAALEADAQRAPVEAAGAEGGRTVHRQRADAHDEAELGAEAFLDNDYVPGELDAPAERPAHVRAPHDEADFDAESEDAAARQARRERRSGDEEARESSGPETVVPEDVDMEALAGMAARAADDAAAHGAPAARGPRGPWQGQARGGQMSEITALFTWVNIRFLLQGLGMTLLISALAILCSVVLGTVISVMRTSSSRVLRGVATVYIEIFKNTPLLLWIMFTFFVAQLPPIGAAVLAFTLFTSASVAEIVRGGLASVPFGQYEAAKSQGFSTVQTYLLIILPQALRNMVPALLSQFVTTIKDTSYLWGAMALQELMGRGMILMNSYNSTVQIFAIFGIMALIYFVVCFTLSQIVRAYQRRLKEARTA